MKNFKFPKFQDILRFILMVIFTSFFVLFIYIALPQTERMIGSQRYDLNLSQKDYWSKEYTIELKNENDVKKSWQYINETKSIIQNRLSKLGISDVTFKYEYKDVTTGNLIITVKTDRPANIVDTIIQSQLKVKIMVVKDGVVFDAKKDPYGKFNPVNYTETDIVRNDFRTIYVSKLKTTAGDYSYFGIFKPWIWKNSKYYNFLATNSGKEGGVYTDGFVTPISFPVYEPSNSSYRSAKPILSVGIGSDVTTAKTQDILYNSGNIPISYIYKTSKPIEANKPNIDMIKYSLFISVIFLFVYFIYSYVVNKVQISTVLNLGFSIVALIDYLKLTQTSISIQTIIITAIFGFVFSLLYSFVKQRNALVVLLLSIFGVLYINRLGWLYSLLPYFLFITVVFPVVTFITQYYSKLFKTFFSK